MRLILRVVMGVCGGRTEAAPTSQQLPSLTDAVIQPLDSSARNHLICMGLTCGLCGLRASFRERGRSEEWLGESGMWPGTADSGGWRSPQASAGTPNNTREPARSGKKKPQPRTVGVSLLVEAATITSPYESICCAAKRQKCPHRYPQITSPGFFGQIPADFNALQALAMR